MNVGSVWIHHSGRRYEVIDIYNTLSTDNEKFPVMVAFQDQDSGAKWCREASGFLKSCKKVH